MTLAERLHAIQAEYRSAIAEAAALKCLAAEKSTELHDALERAWNAGVSVDQFHPSAQLAKEIAQLRDQADAVSERASELRVQITEMEAHLGTTPEAAEAGILAQLDALRRRSARLREAEASQADASKEPEAREKLKDLQNAMEQLRADYLRNRIKALVDNYLTAAHELVDLGAQLTALCEIAGRYGHPVELGIRNLEIPLPSGKLASQWGLTSENLRMEDQRIHDLQSTLDSQLASILRF